METGEKSRNWDIVGHMWAVGVLQRALQRDRLSHAYLVTGRPGVGRTTLARALARALLCQGEGERPCGVCRACHLVESGNHPDLHLVESEEPGAAIKIEQVRHLQRQLALTPVEGHWRVAILRRFEEATISAANALLKTLEEPPAYVVLAVLTTDADRLLPTIVSRCQHIPLRPLPVETVQRALIERWGAEPNQARLLAHLSGGRMGWAVSTLEDKTALEDRSQRLDDLGQLLSASVVERFRYAERLARNRSATQQTLDLWIGWWRDVLLMASQAGTSLTNIDREKTLRDHARRYGARHSAAMLEALRTTADRLERNANARLALEVLMLDLPRA